MSNSSIPFALSSADEASWGDDSNVTFDERIPLLAPVDVSGLTQNKQPMGRAMQYTNQAEPHIRMPYEASFTTSMALTGHGSTCAGAITISDLGRLLGRCIGNNSVGQAGTTVAAAPTSASQFGLNGGTVLSGGLIRVGAQKDSRGGGQWAAVNNASTITLLTALAATPNENDVVYASELIYPYEGASAGDDTMVSQRMQFQSLNQIYRAWGVFPQSLTISLPIGGVGKIDITWGAAKAVPIGSAPTWPNATAKDEFSAQPVGGGELWQNDNGTTTRAIKAISEFNLTIDLQVTPLMGQSGTDVYQNITGAVRTKCQASFNYVELAEASGTNTPYDAWNTDTGTAQHVLYGASVGRDGASLGFYFPKVERVGAAPIMHVVDNVWRVRSHFLASTSDLTTNALTLANFVIGLG